MSAERAVLRASKKLGSPPGKPSGDCYFEHLYDSECSGTDDDESKALLRRKAIGVIDGIEGEFMII